MEWTLKLISFVVLALVPASYANTTAEVEMPDDTTPEIEIESAKPPFDLASILTGPREQMYWEAPPHSTTTTIYSDDEPEETRGAEKYFSDRLYPSNVVNNFNKLNLVKVFTYEPAPELDVPQNESVAYLLEVMAEANRNIDRLILQAAREVSEYYRQVLLNPETQTGGQNTSGELYDLVYKNLKALLGTLDDYPILKESLFLWSSLDDDDEDEDEDDVDGSVDGDSDDGPTGRDFKFPKFKKTKIPEPPRFICPGRMSELVNCWSYDLFDSVSDNAKYYLNPFSW